MKSSMHKFSMRHISIVCIALSFLFYTSCKKQKNEIKESYSAPRVDNVPDDVVSKLTKAGFDVSEGLKPYRDGYLVEYDIYLNKDQIDKLEGNPDGIEKHYRSHNTVKYMPRVLNVFMDPEFGEFMQLAFDSALVRYNNQNLGLSFQRTTTRNNADIQIIAYFDITNTLGFSNGFPSSAGHPANRIELNTFHFSNTSRRADAVTVIAHEIGHAIGYRHTDHMNRTFSCGSGGAESSTAGAVHISGTPSGPSADSWMLACSNRTNRPFTTSDRAALRGVYGSGWSQTSGKAIDIACGPEGSVFMIGTDNRVYKWVNHNWINFTGTAISISVDPKGTPWVIGTDRRIYRWTGSAWTRMPGEANNISIGADGTIYVVGTDSGIYKWTGSGWTRTPGKASRIAVDPTGKPWVVGTDRGIYRWTGSTYQKMPGAAYDIGIGADGTVFMTGTNTAIYTWNGSSWRYIITNSGVRVEVTPQGNPWVINPSNIIRSGWGL